jgi:probable F420-dependent oxidoreductase
MFQYPEVPGAEADMLGAGPVAELAQAAEAAGFSGFALTEHPAPSVKWLASGGHQTLDPFVSLGHIAAVTTQIRLLTYLCVMPYRNPLLLAKAAATVDLLAGGRFILGVGTGYLKSEYRSLGVDFEERNALFDEALDVLPLAWSGEPFSYEGTHFSCRDVIARPAPQSGSIPIWIGGNSALTRRRVADRAQGWMPMTGPPELFRTTRTPALDETSELPPAITSLRAAAAHRDVSIDIAVPFHHPALADRDSDLRECAEAFARHESAGVTWVIVNPATRSRSDSLAFLESFGTQFLNPSG